MSDYDTDIVVWAGQQAALLRRMAAGERVNDLVDWQNVAEEIEDLARSDRRMLNSQVRRVLEHLLKLDASTAQEPRRGWEESVDDARAEIEVLLEDSPSLRRELPDVIARQLPKARARVAASFARYGETPRVPLDSLSYGAADVLSPE